jgi:ring-1,2-phenylacetyl-CoA epoxidase subunit PaaE
MAAPPRFHALRVAAVQRQTADSVAIAFDVPPELADAYRFAPGQYLTLRRDFADGEKRRSYSICSGPDDSVLRIGVKRVDGGAVSSWVNDAIAAGDVIDVMTPTGRFGVAHDPGAARIHACFAAGSGITPILSIARGLLAREKRSRVFLFYGNRSVADIMFREEIEDLKDRYLGRFSVLHVLSRESQDLPVLNGRLDREKVQGLLRHAVPGRSIDHAFVCGPVEMSETVEAALAEIGLPPERIHVERFVSAHDGIPRAAPRIEPTEAPFATATIVSEGRSREVPVAAGETVLDAALRAGIDLPYACKGGMCCTCRARVTEGSAEMAVNFSLEAWEIAAGFTLTCQAHPTSTRVVVDYDQM